MKMKMMFSTTKKLAIFLGLATTAFCVSTVILAIEKTNLENELQDALHKLEAISTLTTAAATPTTPSPSSTSLPQSSTEQTSTNASSNSTEISSSTEFPTPSSTSLPQSSTEQTSTTEISSSTEFPSPSFPTLPPGLTDPEQIIYHLPNDIRPIKYKLYIHPDLISKTCEGSVSIQIEIDKETNLIVLHAKDLDINAISILNMMARIRIRIRKFYLDVDREMLFIELDEVLFTMTPYVVSINYNCQMNGLQGLYASYYPDAGSESRRTSFLRLLTQLGVPSLISQLVRPIRKNLSLMTFFKSKIQIKPTHYYYIRETKYSSDTDNFTHPRINYS